MQSISTTFGKSIQGTKFEKAGKELQQKYNSVIIIDKNHSSFHTAFVLKLFQYFANGLAKDHGNFKQKFDELTIKIEALNIEILNDDETGKKEQMTKYFMQNFKRLNDCAEHYELVDFSDNERTLEEFILD